MFCYQRKANEDMCQMCRCYLWACSLFYIFLVGHLLPLYIASILIVIMLIDWSLQTFLGIPSTNPRRLITGFVGGLGVGIFIWTGIGYLINIFNIKNI